MKQRTEQDVFLTLAALCAQGEHCQYEMLEKMRRWEVDETVKARVMQKLVAGRYIDDERFARAFVKDKVRYNKWGRRKVEQALWMKRIDEHIAKAVLDEVDDEEYTAILTPMLKQKRRSTKANSDYELNMKLIKYALSRGFTMDIIKQCINVEDESEFLD